MKVLIFGHSYVEHLKELGNWNRNLTLENGKGVGLEFEFRGYRGKDFDFFLENDRVFNVVSEVNPDIIVVIIGGNSIVDSVTNSEIKKKSCLFFRKLNNFLSGGCIRLVAQVEPRYSKTNKFGTPSHLLYEKRRNIINNHYNKALKKLKLVDNIIMLGSVNNLNKRENFSDGVHLNKTGLRMYQDAVLRTISYVLNRQ